MLNKWIERFIVCFASLCVLFFLFRLHVEKSKENTMDCIGTMCTSVKKLFCVCVVNRLCGIGKSMDNICGETMWTSETINRKMCVSTDFSLDVWMWITKKNRKRNRMQLWWFAGRKGYTVDSIILFFVLCFVKFDGKSWSNPHDWFTFI